MPSLPTAAPAFLPSPALCLAAFAAVFTVVGVAYSIYRRVLGLLAQRWVRLRDVEAGGINATVVVDTKTKARPTPKNAAAVLAFARKQFIKDQHEVAAKMHLVSVHKELMGYPAVPTEAPKVAAVVPGTAAFVKREAHRPSKPWVPRHLRKPLGASPLRTVYTAPPPLVSVVTRAVDVASKYQFQNPAVAPTPVISAQKSVPFVSTARSRLLANLLASTDDHTSSDYSDDEESTDANHPHPALPVLRDSRLRNLWKAAANSVKTQKILDRQSKRKYQLQNKENIPINSK